MTITEDAKKELVGKKAIIIGKVSFCALSKKITSQYDRFNGNKELYRLKLRDVKIVRAENEAVKELIANKFYHGKDENGNQTNEQFFDIKSSSNYSPAIFDNNHPDSPVTCVEKEMEIAKNTLVQVSLGIFKSKEYDNLGIGINAIQVTNIEDSKIWAVVGQPSFDDAFNF